MNPDSILGIKIGIAIWVVGILSTIVVHLLVGWDYPHAPPFSFLVVCLTVVISLIRFLSNFRNILFGVKVVQNKAELFTHLLGFTILSITFFFVVTSSGD